MYKDFVFWTYSITVIVSFGTGTVYLWWLLWVLRKNKHLSNGNKRTISKPYIYDMILFFGIGISQAILLYARILLNCDLFARDGFIQSWLWGIKNWLVIIPLLFIGIRAVSRIWNSLPRD